MIDNLRHFLLLNLRVLPLLFICATDIHCEWKKFDCLITYFSMFMHCNSVIAHDKPENYTSCTLELIKGISMCFFVDIDFSNADVNC